MLHRRGKQSSSRYSSSLLPASHRARWGPHHRPGAKSLSSPRDLAGGGSLMAFLPRHTLFTLNILYFNHEGFPPALQAQLRDSTARRCAAVAASFQSSLLGSPPGIARRISVLTQLRSPAEPPPGSASHHLKTPYSLFKVTKPPPGASSQPPTLGHPREPPCPGAGTSPR